MFGAASATWFATIVKQLVINKDYSPLAGFHNKVLIDDSSSNCMVRCLTGLNSHRKRTIRTPGSELNFTHKHANVTERASSYGLYANLLNDPTNYV